MSEVEFSCKLLKTLANVTYWNNTSLFTKGYYTHENNGWLYENKELKFCDDDYLHIFTFYKYLEPYTLRRRVNVTYHEKTALKTSAFNIHVPNNAAPYSVLLGQY